MLQTSWRLHHCRDHRFSSTFLEVVALLLLLLSCLACLSETRRLHQKHETRFAPNTLAQTFFNSLLVLPLWQLQHWSSGYDACPTRRRSPVQSWDAVLWLSKPLPLLLVRCFGGLNGWLLFGTPSCTHNAASRPLLIQTPIFLLHPQFCIQTPFAPTFVHARPSCTHNAAPIAPTFVHANPSCTHNFASKPHLHPHLCMQDPPAPTMLRPLRPHLCMQTPLAPTILHPDPICTHICACKTLLLLHQLHPHLCMQTPLAPTFAHANPSWMQNCGCKRDHKTVL
jgi:hypothetical protein